MLFRSTNLSIARDDDIVTLADGQDCCPMPRYCFTHFDLSDGPTAAATAAGPIHVANEPVRSRGNDQVKLGRRRVIVIACHQILSALGGFTGAFNFEIYRIQCVIDRNEII